MNGHTIPREKGQKGGVVIAGCVINKQEDRLHNRCPLCWVTVGKEWSWREEKEKTNVDPQSQNMALHKSGIQTEQTVIYEQGQEHGGIPSSACLSPKYLLAHSMDERVTKWLTPQATSSQPGNNREQGQAGSVGAGGRWRIQCL